MRVAVVGAGAMGCLFGALLKSSGSDVLLVDRNPVTVRQIAKKGVSLLQRDGAAVRVRLASAGAGASLRGFELVLFAVKAYDTEQAASQYARKIDPGAVVLTLQNGLGNLEVLSRRFGAGSVVAGSTTEGSLLKRPGFVVHTGKGRTLLGELDGARSSRCVEIVRMFRRAGFEAGLARNVMGVIWAKAIVNSAINPVSALTRLRNGELAGAGGLRRLMLEALREGARVSEAEGVRLEPRDTRGLLFRILKATAANRSSMLQDVMRGGRTEVRELNGAIAERGRGRGIPTPYNDMLTALVLGLEGPRAPDLT